MPCMTSIAGDNPARGACEPMTSGVGAVDGVPWPAEGFSDTFGSDHFPSDEPRDADFLGT